MSANEIHQALRELEDLRYAAGNLDEALRRIVEATHQLFAVDGAGLMLVDPDQLLRIIAVSDQRIDDLATVHPWSPEGELALVAFTDLAALTIANTMQSEQRGELAAQLQRALDARVVIEQAKGGAGRPGGLERAGGPLSACVVRPAASDAGSLRWPPRSWPPSAILKIANSSRDQDLPPPASGPADQEGMGMVWTTCQPPRAGRCMHGSDPALLAGRRASPALRTRPHPIETLWANPKRQELANLATDDLGEVMTAAHRGIERIRYSWWLPYAFARRCGIHF